MNYRPIIVALAVFAVFVLAVAGVFVTIGQGYESSTRTWEANESIADVSPNTTYEASPTHVADSFQDDELVENGSGARLEEGVDYSWNTSTGDLTFKNSSTVQDSTNATLAYGYSGHMQGAYDVYQVQTDLAPLIPWLTLLFAAFVVLVLFLVAGGAVLTTNGTMFR